MVCNAMTMPLPPSTVADALASLAARESRRAIRALSDTADRHKGVHEARKSIRRLKSLLALGEEPFGKTLEPVWAELSSLAKGLSSLRDAHVAATIARGIAGERPSPPWKRAIGLLEARRDAKLGDALRKDPAFRRRRQRLADVGAQIQSLSWSRLERHDIEKALARSERRVSKAEARAADRGTDIDRHRWRRRARRLRMQLEFWRKALKAVDASSHHRAHHDKAAMKKMSELSDALGARQDLRSLRRVLRTLDGIGPLAPLLDDIRQALKAQSA